MATALVDICTTPLLHIPFVNRLPPPNAEPPRESPSSPPEVSSLIQKVQNVERALGITSIDPSKIPPRGSLVLQHAISNLGTFLKTSITKNVNTTTVSSLKDFLNWVLEKSIAIASAIYRIAFALFRKSPPEATIEAILDELKLSQALSPAQYEAVLQLSKEPEKKPALMLLTTLLGFSTTELSPLLSHSLNTSPEYAFSLLLECFLIKKFTSVTSLKTVLNEEDRRCLSKISIDSFQSNKNIKEQLRCLRSLSYRSTIRLWVGHLPSLFQKDDSQGLIKACADSLKNNDPKAFVKKISPFLSQIASQPLSNESLYAKDLLSFFSSDFTFDRLAGEIRRQKFLSQWGEQISALKKAGKALISTQRCARTGYAALNKALSLLTNENIRSRYLPQWPSICSTFRATQEGSIARTVRKIDGIVKRLAHELDPAETSKEAVLPPKHVLHLACSCGGGHTSMVKALNTSMGKASTSSQYRFTAEELDVPKNVTRPLDMIYKLFHNFGIDIDTTSIYNFLLRNDLCSVIEFLKWLTSGDTDKATTEKKQSLIRQAILARDPDFLNMVYAFDGNDLDEVSQQLGLPLLYVATDLDLNDWRRLPTSPFFKEAVPSLQHPGIRRTLHLPLDQVEEIGLCVGPEFETRLSPEQAQAVRDRYSITPNERVILFSNGGTALQNTIPERIALEYTDTSRPIHLIVLCGKNESFKTYLERKVLPFIPTEAPVKMTVLGFQQKAQMAELSQIADVAIGKPGGMSTMEFVKTGTRVIFDETSYRLHWERFNASVVVNSGRGMIMESPDQLLPLIKESLKSPRCTPMKMAQIQASERYVNVVNNLLTSANGPEEEHGWREKRRSWHKMNKKMATTTIG